MANIAEVAVGYIPDAGLLMKRTSNATSSAEALEIDSPEMYEWAMDLLKKIKKEISDLDTERKGITKKLDDAKKAIMDHFRKPIEAFEKAEAIIKRKGIDYNREQERIRAEKQKAIDDAAKAERQRIENEAAQREDAARKEREEALKKADEAIAQGKHAEAEVITRRAQEKVETVAADNQTQLALAQTITAPAIEEKAPEVKGISMVKEYRGECYNSHALFAHCAIHLSDQNLFTLNQSALNARARSNKDQFNLPGCRLVVEDNMRASKR